MFVAREDERRQLLDAYESDRSQFVAIYGRRRVGKTFLVRETFDYAFTFQHAGLAKGTLSNQLFGFCASLKDAGLVGFEPPSNWLEAFELLKDLIRSSSDKRKLIFIDELSWMDTPRCDLMVALESFWNGWASARRDIVLIVCASATSWMLDKVIHNKGGLYNRLTVQISLKPFSLHECDELARSLGIALNHHQLIECYMALGGVPYYWTHLRKGLSLPQNIDAMFFAHEAPLREEFDYLFSSLFRYPADYLAIVEALATRKAGMTREEIIATTGLADSGSLTKRLANLESCGFIRKYLPFGRSAKGALYQLTDHFTLFALRFLRGRVTDESYWSNTTNTPARNAWCGIAFERVCLAHVPQIKAALGVSGVASNVSSWTCRADPDKGIFGSQIDLLIDRRDQVINLCEMKYSIGEYAITKRVDEGIRHKVGDLQLVTKTKSSIHVTLVTPYGLKENSYSGSIQAVITGDDLFRE